MSWRTWVIVWPARVVDAVWLLYRLYLALIILGTFTILLLALLLAALGIRWGW